MKLLKSSASSKVTLAPTRMRSISEELKPDLDQYIWEPITNERSKSAKARATGHVELANSGVLRSFSPMPSGSASAANVSPPNTQEEHHNNVYLQNSSKLHMK
mmetsp:Transcript_7121/g.19079  ORF Transcript_7121/g.19079 Transcript_7121/m.19079 type:complete len:103 (+) Transcript_7121:432-740(+)